MLARSLRVTTLSPVKRCPGSRGGSYCSYDRFRGSEHSEGKDGVSDNQERAMDIELTDLTFLN